jgi:3-oxoacyl-[acyl-carrier protein] reductase
MAYILAMDDLTGKVALVTGAGRGIGRAIAIALAGAGVDVVVNYRERAAGALEVVERIRALGRRAIAVQADVSLAQEVRHLVAEAERGLGPIDVLVNNAGIARVQRAEEISEQDWDELIAVNLKSCFLVSQAVLPGMRARRWGRLIFLSSVAAQLGGVVGPHYAASKAGMIGLSHGYATQLAKEGITSNAIAPALIETEMVTVDLGATANRIPVGRVGHVDEIAEVAVMLARNAFMTGQTISINGGLYMTS